MSDSTVHNLLTKAARGEATHTFNGVTFSQESDGWVRVSGTATSNVGWRTACSAAASDPVRLATGTYTLSAVFEGVSAGYIRDHNMYTDAQLYSDDATNGYTLVADFRHGRASSVTITVDEAHAGLKFQLWGPIIRAGMTVDMRVRYMLVAGTEPAAWAPADGETLAGGGCSHER